MAAPISGDYFKKLGVIPASRRGVTTALEAGHDVVVWPGGEPDAMRSWTKRDKAVLAGRRGFVKQAMRSGVPIVPVATVGGLDTVFVLSEGRAIAKYTGLGRKLRGATIPATAGPPFGLAIEITPMHIPLPAKIRTEILNRSRSTTIRSDSRTGSTSTASTARSRLLSRQAWTVSPSAAGSPSSAEVNRRARPLAIPRCEEQRPRLVGAGPCPFSGN